MILNPSTSSSHRWFSIYSRIVCSSTAPTLAQSYTRAHRCCPSSACATRGTPVAASATIGLSGTAPVSRVPAAEAPPATCGCDRGTRRPGQSSLPAPHRSASAGRAPAPRCRPAGSCTGTSSPKSRGTSDPSPPACPGCDSLTHARLRQRVPTRPYRSHRPTCCCLRILFESRVLSDPDQCRRVVRF